jgi:hypothetical protein
MAKTILFPMLLNLQLFAEGAGGGDGGTGAEGATGVNATAAVSQTGETAAPAAEVISPEDRNAKFEALIKGEYKDLYDAKMQDTVQKRLKSTKETVDKYNELAPTLEMLSKKYGVDAADIKALNKAIQEDDSYYEEEALEKGITVEQLKEIRRMERENADLKRQMEEQNRRENANRLYAQWMEQEQQTKAVYPTFNLRDEMQNQKFVDLLRSNIDVRTAYEVIHKDDIIHGAMQFAVNTAEQKIANKIIASGARPTENGTSSQGASLTKSDVSQLSKADRQDILRRVARGEKISFG